MLLLILYRLAGSFTTLQVNKFIYDALRDNNEI